MLSSWSAECWLYRPIDRWLWRLTSPTVGVMSPHISFSSVLLPAPLGPTSATRESQSTPNSRFWGTACGWAESDTAYGGGHLRETWWVGISAQHHGCTTASLALMVAVNAAGQFSQGGRAELPCDLSEQSRCHTACDSCV